MTTRSVIAAMAIGFVAVNVFGAVVVRSGAGLTAATAARDQFRADIGGGTVSGANGSFGGIRREINWDDVPDSFAAPANLPSNFFNLNSPRGVVFSSWRGGFQVSATAASGTPVRFGNINPTYPAQFVTFSAERLFAPHVEGFPITDIDFFLPGTNAAATVSSFGAVFSDIDTLYDASIQLFDRQGNSLGIFYPPAANKDVSFLGVTVTSGEPIAHVRIFSDFYPLSAYYDDGVFDPRSSQGEIPLIDVIAMDDFIYSEPVIVTSVPVMSVPMLAFLAAALLVTGVLAKAH